MTRYFVRHPVMTWMLFTAFVVLGLYAVPRLEVEAIPDVDLPSLSIQTLWNGASPQAVQRSITLPIEEAARKVHGVEHVRSTSRAGRSTVAVEFRRDVEIDFARLELNEQLGTVRRNLPLNAGQPEISAFVPEEFETDEFFSVSLESHLDPNTLRDMAETWIVPRLLAVEGVADARILGGAEPIIKIALDRTALRLRGITADEVFRTLVSLDDLQAAGLVHTDGEDKLVAIRGDIDLDALRRAVVARRGERTYTLQMLGTVEEDFDDPTYFVRENGRNVVQARVEKRSGSNSVGVSRRVRAALPEIQATVPFEVTFSIDEDLGRDLEDKLRELIARSGVILLLLFLLLVISLRQVRLTATVVASIFFAIVICLSLFYFLRLSVNFITISGLTVCFGLILDNSILVLDAIHRRLHALEQAASAGLTGAAKVRVAARMIVAGTNEVMFPILATTLTTIVAFFSFIFLSGRLALYYIPLAISVTTAMAASIFIAFAWIPVVLNQGWARWIVSHTPDGDRDLTDEKALEGFVTDRPATEEGPTWLERLLSPWIRVWWLVLPATLVLFGWAWKIYDEEVFKGGFAGFPESEELFMYLEMPAGTDVRVTSETLLGFEELLDPVPEGARARAQVFDNQAVLRVEFDRELLVTPTPTLYRSLLVEQADATAGTTIFIRGFADAPYFKGSFGGSSLNSLIELTGYNSKRLNEIAERTLRQVSRQRRVRNARITTGGRFERSSLEETVITLDRERLAQHGLTVAELSARIRRILGVDVPWSMLIDGKQERVQLTFDDAETIQFADVESTPIVTPSGDQIHLGDVVAVQTEPLTGPVTRTDQRYSVKVNWEYVGTDKMRRSYIANVLDGMELPYGYEAEEGSQSFLTQEEEEDLRLTLVLAAAFIFMILAALFESGSLPFLVLSSVPLALVGVVMIFWQNGKAFDSSARVGLVLLFGIVVNNAILLTSRFRTEAELILRSRGAADPPASWFGRSRVLGGSDLSRLPRHERGPLLRRAIARGTRIRLRSILLTSGTTIVGLLPLVVDVAWLADKLGRFGRYLEPFIPEQAQQGQDIWENLAWSSIGGLAASTVLLVLVLPALYYGAIRVRWRLEAAWRSSLVHTSAVTIAGILVFGTLPFVNRTAFPLPEAVTTRIADWSSVRIVAIGIVAVLSTAALSSLVRSLWADRPRLWALPLSLAGVLLVAFATVLVCWTTLAASYWTTAVREAPMGSAVWTVAPVVCVLPLLIPRTTRAGAGLLALVLLAGLGVAVATYVAPAPIVLALLAVTVAIAYARLDRPTHPVG